MNVQPLRVQPGCDSRTWYDQASGVRHFQFKRHFVRVGATDPSNLEHVTEVRDARYRAETADHEIQVQTQAVKVEYEGLVAKIKWTTGFQRYKLTTLAHEQNWYQYSADYEPNRTDLDLSGECIENEHISGENFHIDLRPVFSGAGDPICGFPGFENSNLPISPVTFAPGNVTATPLPQYFPQQHAQQPSSRGFGSLLTSIQNDPQAVATLVKRKKDAPSIQGERIQEVTTSDEEDGSSSGSDHSDSSSDGDEEDDDALFVGQSSRKRQRKGKKRRSRDKQSSSNHASSTAKKKRSHTKRKDIVDLTAESSGDEEDSAKVQIMELLADLGRQVQHQGKIHKKKSKKSKSSKRADESESQSEEHDDRQHHHSSRRKRGSKKSRKHGKSKE